MPNIVQVIPVAGPGNALPYALIGLEEGGRIWYGNFVYPPTPQPDGGPSAVQWRPLDAR